MLQTFFAKKIKKKLKCENSISPISQWKHDQIQKIILPKWSAKNSLQTLKVSLNLDVVTESTWRLHMETPICLVLLITMKIQYQWYIHSRSTFKMNCINPLLSKDIKFITILTTHRLLTRSKHTICCCCHYSSYTAITLESIHRIDEYHARLNTPL